MLERVSFSCTVTTTLSQAARVASAAWAVLVGRGAGVAVGYGTFSFCPTTRLLQEAGKLLRMIRLVVEMWNVTAIPPQVSPEATVYSNGACSVIVGGSVGSCVSVGVGDAVGVSV